jgi:UDP-2-acetamido-2,6-beta-L-arabino-hexul-4-ose reductase
MKLLVTGSDGFLGWHTRCRLRALTDHEVIPVGRGELTTIADLARDADAILHLAGVNRAATGEEVERGNTDLAQVVAGALESAVKPLTVIYADSIQTGNGTPYGTGKQAAAQLLADATARSGGTFVDVLLPNLFGEHGRPRYNSFVATFVEAVSSGVVPALTDREVQLLHVQDAAQALLDALSFDSTTTLRPTGTATTVAEVYDMLRAFDERYRTGDIPPLLSDFDLHLFNTLRAALFPDRYPIELTKHSDSRGDLVECVRSHGGQGQTFVSTTHPGITRGEHFHLSKIERFVVLQGQARIALRRLLHDDVIRFDVSGDEPCIVDMPTLWAHNITNTGSDELVTLFWTNSVFNPQAPDTYPQAVASPGPGATR